MKWVTLTPKALNNVFFENIEFEIDSLDFYLHGKL